MKVFDELRKRKVLQTAAVYFAVAWGATEILSYLIERIPVFPAWADTAIAILFVLGFPVAVFLSWMFDVGEDGVRRADPASGIGKGVISVSLGGLLVATGALSYLLLPQIEAGKGLVHEGDLGTVAVLPFENLTGDPSLGYLGVGLAEDIRQRLMAQTDLKVIGRVSMAGFTGAGTDLAALRGILDAGLVLEGNLQEVAGQLQVGITLLDTATAKQVWSNTFLADRAGWDPLRRLIVTSLAEQLALTVRVRTTEAPVPTEALEAYLRGLAELNRPAIADSWFDEAVRLAPDFADAWARKALLRVDMIWRGQSILKAWDEAEPMFERAREAEPDNLLADFAEASLLWVAKLDPLASYEILQRAEARAPNHPLVLAGLTTALCFVMDRGTDEVAYGRRYVAQDPLNPDAHNRLGLALQFNGRLDEALTENARALELDPNFMRAWDYRANWQFYHSRPADALVTLTRKAQIENPASDETIRCMIFMAGSILPEDRALAVLEDAVDLGLGMTESHWWCGNPLETLAWRLEVAGREKEARAVRDRLEKWYADSGALPIDETPLLVSSEESSHCEDDLCRIRESMGNDTFDSWLGSNPPLQYFNMGLTVHIVQALLEAGRDEDARRLAALAAPVFRRQSDPVSAGNLLDLLAISGDIEGAVDYAERIGPEGFYLFGVYQGDVPELAADPGWQAFHVRCEARLQAEIEKFDRLVASGEIHMP